MLRRSTIAGLILVMAGILTFSGCSSSSTQVDSNVGDPNAPEFQSMKSAISVAVDSTLAIALNFAHKPDRYPNEGNIGYDRPQLGPSDSLLYNYVNDWHVLYFGGAGAANYDNVYVDSAQYWEGSDAVELFRWDRVTKLALIRHQSMNYSGSGSEYENVSAYFNAEFDHWGQVDQSFTGTAKVTVDSHYLDGMTAMNDTYEFEISADNVQYSNPSDYWWNERKADSGTLTITGTVTTAAGDQSWTVSVEFTDGTADVSAQLGDVVYQYSMTPAYN
jgi:hypothetical protein